MEPIAADEMVIEYVGQIIRQVGQTQTDNKAWDDSELTILCKIKKVVL